MYPALSVGFIVTNDVVNVPLPGSIWYLGSVLAGLLAARRRERL